MTAGSTGRPLEPHPAIELTGITKRFPGIVANDGIELTVAAGEIHAVCGENGAGKSTLMKILYGMLTPDEGTLRIRGEKVALASPSEAIALGVGMVHQHFMLADHLTVLENVILGSEPMQSLGRIDFSAGRRHLSEVGQAYGLNVHPDDLVATLEVGERQRVEIIKVLYRGASILILDEPTAVLVPQEVDELFRNISYLRAAGATILFISHKLDEVMEIADAITVLRHGRVVDTVRSGDTTTGGLAEMMIGLERLSSAVIAASTTSAVDAAADSTVAVLNCPASLAVENLTVLDDDGRAAVDGVSLRVHKGEVVGIAGVEGNGQAELASAVLGTLDSSAGRIFLLGTDVTRASVRVRREAGLRYIPQDRHREGLILDAPLWENTTLGHQTRPPCSRWRWLNPAGMRFRARRIRSGFDVRTPSVGVPAYALSGGNQQKLLVGREMTDEAAVLIAAHPTRGIDMGSRASVWDHISAAKVRGLATLLMSADLDELISLSDVLLVMLRGRIVARLDPNDADPRVLGAYMTGAEAFHCA